MRSGWMKSVVLGATLAVGFAGAANAVPTRIFSYSVNSTSVGAPDTNVGTVTLKQIDSQTVQIALDLAAGYGLLNSGSHTPFAFNLSSTIESGLSISSWITPGPSAVNSQRGKVSESCVSIFCSGTYFQLDTASGGNSPFGTFTTQIEYIDWSTFGGESQHANGSGAAYYGDLIFELKRTAGLSISDFVTSGGFYFSADVTDGSNTGAQAWKTFTDVPEPMTLSLFGAGVAGAAFMRRRKVKKA